MKHNNTILEFKILKVDDIAKLSIDSLIEAYRNGYRIEGLSTCNSPMKIVGQTVSLLSTPADGTAPYTVNFYKNNSLLNSQSNISENQTITYNYILTSSDIGIQSFSVTTTDSCPSGSQTSSPDVCSVSVLSGEGGGVTCDPTTCPTDKNYCITGTCIPKKYVLYGGVGFGVMYLLTLLK